MADDDPRLPVVETVTENEDTFDDQRAIPLNAVDVLFPKVLSNMECSPELDSAPVSAIHDNDDAVLSTRAHFDTAAFASCTGDRSLLHDYTKFTKDSPCPVRLAPASEGSDVRPHGVGYLHVPAPNPQGFIPVRTFYHPKLRTTVIDERDLLRSPRTTYRDFTGERLIKHTDNATFEFHASHRVRRSQDIHLFGVLQNDKCYTAPLIPCDVQADHPKASAATSSAKMYAEDPEFRADCERATIQAICAYQDKQYAHLRESLRDTPVMYHGLPFHEYIQKFTPVNTIKRDTQRLLWHQRLGHPSDYYLYHAHKHVKGVPAFAHEHPILDNCPTCIQSKQTKEPAGHNSTRTAIHPYQGLSIDFSFSGVKSKDEARTADYLGLNGETSWILVSDHVTRRLHGDTRVSKATPIEWLRQFLTDHDPNVPDKYVFMDQGGELYRNPEVQELFKSFGYQIRPTGADASNQNGPVERAHRTVANAIRSMLHGARLDIKFWPYAFHHFLRIHNALPARDQDMSPIEAATGAQDDFTGFRTFGCRVWVRPSGRRSAKFRNNSRKGIFLGFLPNTTKNIVWYDEDTHRIKLAKHARFDEGMNDLPFSDTPPNVQHLMRSNNGAEFPAETAESSVEEFTFTNNPFSHTISRTLKAGGKDETFGMEIATDELSNRAFVSHIKPNSRASKLFSSLKATNNKIRYAYIDSINGLSVFTRDDVLNALRKLHKDNVDNFEIVFAPERHLTRNEYRRALKEHDLFQPDLADETAPVNQLSLDDIRSISTIRFPDVDFYDPDVSTEEIALHLNAIASHAVTPDELALGRFTRRRLKRLDTWPEWRDGERKQLDHFHNLGMYGRPQPRPPGAIVLRPHWMYKVKLDGTRRSRNCCDGSPRSAPVLHGIASTYSNCVAQPIQRMFVAIAANCNYRIYGGDAQDAYAHSPPPQQPTFVSIDDAYAEWYKHRFGTEIDRSHVLPVLHALQGHPESGRLWETHINGILSSPELGFKTTTHDRTIYSTVFDGHRVYLLRQVDDFSLACPNETIARRIFDIIGRKLQLPGETSPPFQYLGLLKDFNGISVSQERSSITVHCADYISRVLKTHGWSTPDARTTDPKRMTPLPHDCDKDIYFVSGPAEHTTAHAELAQSHGFSYRSLLGELMYAYVTCRPDIGYALTLLSKFSSAPAAIHYDCLKHVAKYLRRTINWGLVYSRPQPDHDLPPASHAPVFADDGLPPFPSASHPMELQCFVDAAHANDLRNRRSTTGYVFTLCGAAISYRTKTQSITATSSTEAEFLAAVLAAKHAKYLRAVLQELGFAQEHATPIYEDNMSAIKMINSRVPTERSRHIAIQHFAIQDWKEANDIVMRHIPGVINPADAATKNVGWTLHSRHVRRLMGHYG